MADRNANIVLSMRNQAEPEVRRFSVAIRDMIAQLKQAGATQAEAERRALSHAAALSRLATTSGNAAQGERILAAALSQVDRESTAAIRAETQLVAVQNRLAQSPAKQYIDAFKTGLAGIVGPAAVATAAIGAIAVAVRKTEEAFRFKAALDATRQSITTLIGETRNSGQLFAEAAQFANRYKLTQQESNEILANSIDILRTSSRGVGELEANLLRLQSRDISKPISEAARALRELQSGDVTSIKELFNVSARDAHRMKNEIAGGADAVKVLGEYLDRAGVGMQVLEDRTKGSSGKLRDLAVEAERLSLALGSGAQGPGLAILNAKLIATQSLTADLRGEWDVLATANQAFAATLIQTGNFEAALAERTRLLRGETQQAAQVATQASTGFSLQSAAMIAAGNAAGAFLDKQRQLAVETQESSQKSIADAAAKDNLTAKTALLQAETNRAVDAFVSLHPNIDAAGVAALIMAGKIDPLLGQLALLKIGANEARDALAAIDPGVIAQGLSDQRAGERSGGAFRTEAEADSAGRLAQLQGQYARDRIADNKRIADAQAAEAKRIRDAQVALDLARAKSSAARIAVLQRELAGTTDIAERLRIQTQIEQERNSAAKGHTSELDKQLSLNERIADSQAKQARAQIDARLAILDFRKQQILDEQEARKAENAFRNARDPRIRELADLARQRIPLEQQARFLDIQEKLATAGGDIVKGRIVQGQRGAVPLGLPPLAPPSGAVGGVSPGAIGAPAGVEVRVFLDSNEIAARIETRFRSGLRAATAGG
jgi:hypothetical protein